MSAHRTALHPAVVSAVVHASGSHATLERAGASPHHYAVRVRQDDTALSRAVGAHLAPLSADLFDVAVAVAAADRSAPRPRARFGRGPSPWRRRLDVTVPVREPDRWRSAEVASRLEDALSFLTEDEWTIRFRGCRGERRPSERQGHLFPAPSGPVRVALHSGGLDSFAGAAIDMAEHPESDFLVVSGVASNRIGSVQRSLARALALQSRRTVCHVAFRYGFSYAPGEAAPEKTQRTRGFLFTAIGAAAALAAGASRLDVYENGIGAINLPYDGTQLGTAGTRAMHPVALLKMARFVAALVGRDFAIENRFATWTKAEMCAHPALSALEGRLADTFSCDSFPIRRRGMPQCGTCTSCILRRQSLGVAGRGAFDPVAGYVRDVLAPDFDDQPVRHRVAWNAMNRQADVLRARLAQADPWLALTQEFPDLRRIEAELVSAKLAQASALRRQVVSLLSRYVAEWSAFADGATSSREEQVA
jgi:hypothetical protein